MDIPNNNENIKRTQTSKKYIVIMAGGSGTRMKSNVPKQLMNIGNVPMMVHLLNNAVYMQAPVILVVSTKNKDVILKILLDGRYIHRTQDQDRYICKSSTCGYDDIDVWINVQPIANGTGGAILATSEFLRSVDPNDSVLVLSADVPLITKKTMNLMFDKISNSQSHCCILAKDTLSNFGYGRICMDDNGGFIKIVEQKDCSDEEKNITLINNGVYTFKIGSLLSVLPLLEPNNAQNEYYLTDCAKLIRDAMSKVPYPVKVHVMDNNQMYDETLGANTPEQLEDLRNEYIKKFSIESIDGSDINMSDYNLQNLIRILGQLSPSNSAINLDKLRLHIETMNESKINKKHLMVIKYEDIVVGTGSVLIEDKLIHCMGKVGHIEDVVVDEMYRNLGLAKMLMVRLIEFARDAGCYKVILDASDTVEGFYKKLGFHRHANNMRMDF
jgi:NDP-sugar pyrophosphorylase family protein